MNSVRLSVIGTGLIGTSLALAAGLADEQIELTGWDPDPDELATAAERSRMTAAATLEQAVSEADVVVLAAPVGSIPGVAKAALAAAPVDAAITDVGSTKESIVNSVADARFVGGHPLAGGEVGGAAQARPDLFSGATWFLTPVETTAGVQLERVFRLVKAIGAKPRAVAPDVHDRILATVSHLPHVLANLLVAEAAATLSEEGESLPASGPSFRDATRVAGAPSSIWTDIYISNADALVERIRSVEGGLARVREMLEQGDAEAMMRWNDAAASMKHEVGAEAVAGGAVRRLQVKVPNRPGVLAEVALALGGAGIGLADLQLLPAADRATGVIIAGIESPEQLIEAKSLISGLGHPVSEIE